MAFKSFYLACFACFLMYETSEMNVDWAVGDNKKSSNFDSCNSQDISHYILKISCGYCVQSSLLVCQSITEVNSCSVVLKD